MATLQEKLKMLVELGITPTPEQLQKLLVDDVVEESKAKKPTPKDLEDIVDELEPAPRIITVKAKEHEICGFTWPAKGQSKGIHFKSQTNPRHLCGTSKGHDTDHICLCGWHASIDTKGTVQRKGFVPRPKAVMVQADKPKPKVTAEEAGERDRRKDLSKMERTALRPHTCHIQREDGKGECGAICANRVAFRRHWQDAHPANWNAGLKKNIASKRGQVKCPLERCLYVGTYQPVFVKHMHQVHKWNKDRANEHWMDNLQKQANPTPAKESIPRITKEQQAVTREDIILAEIGRHRDGVTIDAIVNNTNIDGGAVYSIVQRLSGRGNLKAVKSGGSAIRYVLAKTIVRGI